MSVCMTKSNKLELLEIKLLRFSYFSIKSLKSETLKDSMISFKLETKNDPKEIPKTGLSNPKRYNKHSYHFTI